MQLTTNLSQGEARFALWLEANLPEFLPLWDFSDKAYSLDGVEHYLAVASHGQALMLRFALGIWRHDNTMGFDLFEAAATCDDRYRKVIIEWVKAPWWA